jgi:hypothetical protein
MYIAGPDAELISLVEQAIIFHQDFSRAEETSEELFSEYDKRRPERPDDLRWRIGDPVGYAKPDPSQPRAVWCNLDDIEELRQKGIDRTQWWAGDPERLQRRADQIIAAHDCHQAELTGLITEVGLDEARARADDAFDRYREASERAVAIRATTIEGLRAKARLVLVCCWGGKMQGDGDYAHDDQIMASMVRDLVGAVS